MFESDYIFNLGWSEKKENALKIRVKNCKNSILLKMKITSAKDCGMVAIWGERGWQLETGLYFYLGWKSAKVLMGL